MKITADTNLLVRAITADDPKQTPIAQDALKNAELAALTTAALCELVWVLSKGYGVERSRIGDAIRVLLASSNVAGNRPEIDAGLAALDDGVDFIDGVIAFQGGALGADVFASFDKAAVKRLNARGAAATLLA